MMFFQEYDVITRGFPAKIVETPQKSPILARNAYRNVRSDTLIESNDTCFVQNFS